MKEALQCTKCSSEIIKGMKFCGLCGTKVSSEKKCLECGMKNPLAFAFCGGCGNPFFKSKPPTEEPVEAKVIPEAEAERRQLTVMFCDLVGSTALSEQLDPEDLRDIILSYQQVCAHAVQMYDGYIAKYLGDGVLVYFGYPVAHEDDAQRSIYAGLEMLEGIEHLNCRLKSTQGLEIGVRIGIHTGIVIAGEMGSGETIEELAIVGKTPNIAARLEGQAPRNTVVVSPVTYRIAKDDVEFVSLGKRELKGIAEPMEVFEVASIREDDGNDLDGRFLSNFIGRHTELQLLHRLWESSCSGVRQTVVIGGEGGIGKSRLLQYFCTSLESNSFRSLSFSCSPFFKGSAFHPFKELFLHWLNIAKNDNLESKKLKLKTIIDSNQYDTLDTNALLLLSSFLGFTNENLSEKLKLTPQKLRERTADLLIGIVLNMANEKPVLLYCEDIQWIDPSSLSLLKQLEESSSSSRLMIMLSSRPPYATQFSPCTHISNVVLSGLSDQETYAFIKSIDVEEKLSKVQIDTLIQKTAGVPLFIEEMVNIMADTQFNELSTTTEFIPERLRDVLTARLDRLGEGKDVVQLAATIGMEFSYNTLRSVSRFSEARLNEILKNIMTSGLLSRTGLSANLTYKFRHGLVQDIAYHSLLKKTRKRVHHQIADILVKENESSIKVSPEIIARHFALAGDTTNALNYWLQAGHSAEKNFELIEASQFFEEGLSILSSSSVEKQYDLIELDFLVGLVNCQMALFGFASSQVESTIERTKKISARVQFSGTKLFPVYYALWVFTLTRGKLIEASQHAKHFLTLAKQEDDDDGLLMAFRCVGIVQFSRGDFDNAEKNLGRAAELYDREKHRALAFSYGQELASGIWAFSALTQYKLGHHAKCLKLMKRSREVALQSGHPTAEIYAETASAWLSQLLGDPDSCQDHANTGIRLAKEQSYHLWTGWNTSFLGWVATEKGDTKKGLGAIKLGMEITKKTGALLFSPYFLSLYANVLMEMGDQAEAERVFNQAQQAAEENDESWYDTSPKRKPG